MLKSNNQPKRTGSIQMRLFRLGPTGMGSELYFFDLGGTR